VVATWWEEWGEGVPVAHAEEGAPDRRPRATHGGHGRRGCAGREIGEGGETPTCGSRGHSAGF
jgi:hypothetical protein